MNSINTKHKVGGTKEIIAINLFTLVFALLMQWDVKSLVVVYWCQSVIIGFFWYKRLLLLSNLDEIKKALPTFPRKASNSNSLFSRMLNRFLENFLPNFLILHYGFFHFVYFIFLLAGGMFANGGWYMVPLIVSTYVYSHWVSFNENIESDKLNPDINRVVFMPYSRIIPMHIIIILGVTFIGDSVNWIYLTTFCLLKMTADVIMHINEHKTLARK